jgi:hypothetical protein
MTLPLALSERAAAYFRDGFRSESGHHNLIPLRQLMTHTGQAYDTARLTIGEAAMEQTFTSIPNTSERCLHLRNRRMSRRG